MLAAGSTLGPYKILAPLGAGGMGEVYRAHDTRLGRDVAIKVLSPHLAATPDVSACFEREARTISQLSHPHICTLHDIGRTPGEAGSDGTDYLVMELLEGETLAHRLERVPLPVAEERTSVLAPVLMPTRLRGRFRGVACLAAPSLLLALVAGCAYIPPVVHEFNRKDIAVLQPGVVTRALVDSLVTPEGIFLYTPRLLGMEKLSYGGTWLFAGGYSGGVYHGIRQRYRMLFRFDDQDVLRSFQVEPWRAEREPVPGEPALPAESDPAESLSFGSSWVGSTPRLVCVAADAAGRIAAGDAKGRVWLWPAGGHAGPMGLELREDVGTQRERTLDHSWLRLAFTDSARALACLAADGTLALVSLPPAPWTSARPEVVVPRWTRRQVTALATCPEGGSVAAALRDRRVALLDAATGVEHASSVREKKLTPVAIALSPDGCRLAMVEAPLYARLRILDCCRAAGSGLPDVAVYPLEGMYLKEATRGSGMLVTPPPPWKSRYDQAGVQVAGLRFSADSRVLVVEALSHVRWLSRTEGSRSGGDSLTLSGAFLRPFAASDLVDETRMNVVSRACPPTFACDGSAIAIVADRLLVYQAPDSLEAPRCLLQGSRRLGSVNDLAAIPGTRRIIAATNRGLFVWEVPFAPR